MFFRAVHFLFYFCLGAGNQAPAFFPCLLFGFIDNLAGSLVGLLNDAGSIGFCLFQLC
jgi:hypothetical protein